MARNLLRKHHDRRRQWATSAERLAVLAQEGDVADQVSERRAALEALATLPEHEAEAVILASWYGLGPAEAAQVAGCSARAFTVRLHRARRRLADALSLTRTTLQEQR
ncbi:sigma factor-like helix-turn-helix DNA-binding protein [Planobispora siamensis]|uniref:RNA polymerase sigma factor 70 region 4 type 2 domain-containing protein n=1 Tax=Planobispora siamensis TaxID=936338 RepID=A0A8J3SR05_9ACTN|nr:sigma factor-like helix-turn-helix DNA-binding protein [Planobispora siamensis]GIH94093.1 hypothetical protein Psi01_47230 [Planobispora siamensis]